LGSAPDPAGGAYSAPPDALAGLRGILLRGGEDKGEEGGQKEEGEGGKGEGERGKGEGREGEWGSPTHYFWLKSCTVSLQQYLYASGSLDWPTESLGHFTFWISLSLRLSLSP